MGSCCSNENSAASSSSRASGKSSDLSSSSVEGNRLTASHPALRGSKDNNNAPVYLHRETASVEAHNDVFEDRGSKDFDPDLKRDEVVVLLKNDELPPLQPPRTAAEVMAALGSSKTSLTPQIKTKNNLAVATSVLGAGNNNSAGGGVGDLSFRSQGTDTSTHNHNLQATASRNVSFYWSRDETPNASFRRRESNVMLDPSDFNNNSASNNNISTAAKVIAGTPTLPVPVMNALSAPLPGAEVLTNDLFEFGGATPQPGLIRSPVMTPELVEERRQSLSLKRDERRRANSLASQNAGGGFSVFASGGGGGGAYAHRSPSPGVAHNAGSNQQQQQIVLVPNPMKAPSSQQQQNSSSSSPVKGGGGTAGSSSPNLFSDIARKNSEVTGLAAEFDDLVEKQQNSSSNINQYHLQASSSFPGATVFTPPPHLGGGGNSSWPVSPQMGSSDTPPKADWSPSGIMQILNKDYYLPATTGSPPGIPMTTPTATGEQQQPLPGQLSRNTSASLLIPGKQQYQPTAPSPVVPPHNLLSNHRASCGFSASDHNLMASSGISGPSLGGMASVTGEIAAEPEDPLWWQEYIDDQNSLAFPYDEEELRAHRKPASDNLRKHINKWRGECDLHQSC